MEYVKISKGGVLKSDQYNDETKKLEKDVDVTSAFLFALNSKCILEDIALKDVFLLIDRLDAYPILSPMFTSGLWLKDIIKEGLAGEDSNPEYLDRLVLGWDAVVTWYDETKDVSFKKDFYGQKDNDNNKYALDLVPTNKFINCRIITNEKIDIKDGTDELERNPAEYRVLVSGNKEFTLYDILNGIFWELSFHGSPANRDKRFNELKQQLDDIKNEKEQFQEIPPELLFENKKEE